MKIVLMGVNDSDWLAVQGYMARGRGLRRIAFGRSMFFEEKQIKKRLWQKSII